MTLSIPHASRRAVARALALTSALLLGACASTPSATGTAGATDAGTADVAHAGAPALAGARPDPSPSAASSSGAAPTLYAELGGRSGVASLSERFIREIATDDRIRGHYRDSDMGRFHRMMQSQMCEVTGGGCVYKGDDMRRTHGGMNITPTEFNAIVEALMRAMDAEGLPVPVQNRLLAIYAPMREDIIDR